MTQLVVSTFSLTDSNDDAEHPAFVVVQTAMGRQVTSELVDFFLSTVEVN